MNVHTDIYGCRDWHDTGSYRLNPARNAPLAVSIWASNSPASKVVLMAVKAKARKTVIAGM